MKTQACTPGFGARLALFFAGVCLLSLFPIHSNGERIPTATTNELLQTRAKLLSKSWDEQRSATIWFTDHLKKSPQADAVAQFLFDSYPIMGTNAYWILMDCMLWENKSPGLRNYAERLYSEASVRLSTNIVDDFERWADLYHYYDITNAARKFARDLPRVPFFDYIPDYHWSARDSGRGARGRLARNIAHSGDEKAITELAKFLDSPDSDFRRIAAYGLGHTAISRYIAPLQNRLKIETDPRVRIDLREGIENCAYFSLRMRAEQLHPLGRPDDKDANTRQNEAIWAELRQWFTNTDEQTRVVWAYASRITFGSTSNHLEALRSLDATEQSARVKQAIYESANWRAEAELDYLEAVKPGELLQYASHLEQLKAIESSPLVTPKFRKRATALFARAKAELEK